MKTAEETIEWLKFFYEVLGSGALNNREGISNALYYIEKYIEHDKELITKIKELREEATNFHVIGVLDKIIKMIEE